MKTRAKRKKNWIKPNIHGTKVMLFIWCAQLGVVYYELLKPSKTITGVQYRRKLTRLSQELKVLPDPPYSPDGAPSNYNLYILS